MGRLAHENTTLHPDESSPEASEAPATRRRDPEPRSVLVLGAGGSGFAQVGVVRAIESLGIRIDEVIGSGMGAVVGAAFASGVPSEDIEALVRRVRDEGLWPHGAVHDLLRPDDAAEARAATLQRVLDEALDGEVGATKLPFFCGAMSLTTGALRYFGFEGAPAVRLSRAVAASCSAPGWLPPVEIDGEAFVDGGMVEPLPMRVAKARRADLIIAVDMSRAARAGRDGVSSTQRVLARTYELLISAQAEHVLHEHAASPQLVLIQPDVGESDGAALARGERRARVALATEPRTRYLCAPDMVKRVDRGTETPPDHVVLHVDAESCIHCGVCAATCPTGGYAPVTTGSVVRKLHHYECTRDAACARACPTQAITLDQL